MSNNVNVTCTTLEFHDYSSNADKFYRTYEAGNWAVMQWGRTGTVGQWKAQQFTSPSSSSLGAADKRNEKQAKGYTVSSTVYFDYDADRLSESKADLTPLDDERLHHSANQPSNKTAAAAAAATPPGTGWQGKPITVKAQPAVPAFSPPAPPPPDPSLGLHAAFSARALAALSLAATDPSKAMVEFALLNEQWLALEQEHAKAASYLRTLQTMLLSAPAVVSL